MVEGWDGNGIKHRQSLAKGEGEKEWIPASAAMTFTVSDKVGNDEMWVERRREDARSKTTAQKRWPWTGRVWVMSLVLLFPSLDGRSEQVPQEKIAVGVFTAEREANGLPKGWQPLTFRKIKSYTQYRVVQDGGRFVVRAEARAAASMLYRKIDATTQTHPILRWSWKVENLLQKSDPTQKSGDDYPARVYVTFQDRTGINYIWESRFPVGRVVPNPYTDDVQMFIVESGPKRLGEWVDETRNLYEDYKRAFGREPSPLLAISLMTDTDNTGESAVAYYADITLSRH